MCGICGWAGHPADLTRLSAAMQACQHRGPDDRGRWAGELAMLGHQRLSILDLSTAGRQPIVNEAGTVQLVFNGEIYNFLELRRELEPRHRFGSRSDSEVLVHGYEEWGIEGLLRRINGMFAFAIWDGEAEVLHLARDRVGKKPLFYAANGGGLAFASTLPSLLELLPGSPQVDPRAVQDYLAYLCVPGERSIVAGVRKLLPGHRLAFRKGECEVVPYWRLSFAEQEVRTEEEWLERIDAEVREAVRRRLVSDVPLGVFLSGGVDSSLVAALMAEQAPGRITTISAGFEEQGFSELLHARRVAEHLGSEHHEHMIRPDAVADLPWMVYTAGEPFGDRAVLPTMYLSRAAREHVTVVLTGDGGDECFAGYPGPLLARMAGPYRRWLPAGVRRELPAALARLEEMGGRARVVARRLRRLAVAASREGPLLWEFDAIGEQGFRGRWDSLFTPGFQARLDGHDPDAYWHRLFRSADGPSDADRVLFTEFAALLPDQFLVKTDVATMAFGLEARSPLLDTRVVELAARIPARQKTRGWESKHLLKRLAARYVPRSVVYRRKQGFAVPTGAWMRGDLAGTIAEVLLSESATRRGIFEPAAVRALVAEHADGRRDHGQRLWLLFMLELWFQMFIDRTLTPSDRLTVAPAASVSV